MTEATQPTMDEIVALAAEDGELFCRTFFPKVFRQDSPGFHWEIWNDWRNPDVHLSAISVFRGGAKTTLLRAFIMLSIAYGVSRTVLYVGASGTKAEESATWFKKVIEGTGENGSLFARTFGLEPGDKWNNEHLEIRHKSLGTTCTIIPVGITGSIRGINIESFRPDLIALDDVQTEENVGTPEQLKKLNDLIYGSVQKTLAPRSEAPNAMMAMLQTPMRPQDLISQAEIDPAWKFRRFGILDEFGESRWKKRFPTADVLKDRASSAARNQLSLWLREMQCVCIPDEGQYFRESDLRYYEAPPPHMIVAYGIDPSPPPSEKQIEKGLTKKDYEAHAVVGITAGGDVYVLEYDQAKNHDPGWSANTFFRLSALWRPMRARVEGIAYQATLEYYLKEEMIRRRTYHPIELTKDQRPKPIRIRQNLSRLSGAGKLYVRRGMREFIDQWVAYPGVQHDDLLDAVSIAVGLLLELHVEMNVQDEKEPDELAPTALRPLPDWRSAP